MFKRNARGSDDDPRQIVADLISSDNSPFTPDDFDGLRMMRPELLAVMRDKYLKPKKAKAEPKDNSALRTSCADGITKADLETIVNAAVAKAVAEVTAALTNTNDLPGGDPVDDPAAGELDELATAAERSGNTEKARKLRKAADDRRATDRARARANQAHAANARLAANVANSGDDDDEVKAMAEFNGDTAFVKALANKRTR